MVNKRINKRSPDLILIHAPSVYDFRKKTIMFGPVSDLVPSTPIFEMYPIGFLTMANYLARRKISVRIINLAYRMYHEKDFNVEKFIKELNPLMFGIDLHWLPHCQGATEIAKIIKKYHDRTPVVFGGFSSSYFYKELINFDEVDYIIRGDSAEEPLYRLIKTLKEGKAENLDNVPNLVWKCGEKIVINPLECVSKDLSEIDFDYKIMFEQVLKYRDIRSVVPFHDWFRYPITTIPVVRGCNRVCANCGGSSSAFSLFGNREKPAFRDPAKLVDEIKTIRKYIDSPVFLLGDLNSNGREYVMEFFKYAKELDDNLQIFFEFFEPPGKWFFENAAHTFKKVCYEISPDSHEEKVRRSMGKTYTNAGLFESVKTALSNGALRFDIYFMTGLPWQTKDSILQTVNFCRKFYEDLGWDSRFMPFISPMAPFLDPGSRIFEDPGKFGYKLLAETLAEHIELITKPSWKYILNYKSVHISTDDLIDSTYEAALGLNRLKGKAGSITEEVMLRNENRINNAISVMKEIDNIMLLKDNDKIDRALQQLKDRIHKYSLSTVCEKKELEFPLPNKNFKWFEIFKIPFS